jgi:hypothetical protein
MIQVCLCCHLCSIFVPSLFHVINVATARWSRLENEARPLIVLQQAYDHIQDVKRDINRQLNAKDGNRRHPFRWPSVHQTSPSQVKNRLNYGLALSFWNGGRGTITLACPPPPPPPTVDANTQGHSSSAVATDTSTAGARVSNATSSTTGTTVTATGKTTRSSLIAAASRRPAAAVGTVRNPRTPAPTTDTTVAVRQTRASVSTAPANVTREPTPLQRADSDGFGDISTEDLSMIDPRVLRGDPCMDTRQTPSRDHDHVPSPRSARSLNAESRSLGGDAPPQSIKDRVDRALHAFVDINTMNVTVYPGAPGAIRTRASGKAIELLGLIRFYLSDCQEVITTSHWQYLKLKTELGKLPGASIRTGRGGTPTTISLLAIKPWAEGKGLGPLFDYIESFLEPSSGRRDDFVNLRFTCNLRSPSPKIAHVTRNEHSSSTVGHMHRCHSMTAPYDTWVCWCCRLFFCGGKDEHTQHQRDVHGQ